MITIIKPGKKEFEATCPKCGCQFKYEITDIYYYFVYCPECNEKYYHPSQINIPVTTTDSTSFPRIDPYTHIYESITPTQSEVKE